MGIGQLMGLDGSGVGQALFESRATPAHNPGFRATDGFGNTYAYAKAGAVLLVAGNALQAPAQDTDHDQLTPAAAAIGATEIVVTLGASGVAENQYAGGKAVPDTTPGLGQDILIEGHAAVAALGTLTLKLGQPLRVALTTSSRITLVPNRFRGVIQTPVTTLTGACVGVCVHPIAATEWGWVGVGGEFGTLIAGTPGVGLAVVVPGTAAGAVVVDGAASATEVVGSIMVTGVDGKVLPVRWNLR